MPVITSKRQRAYKCPQCGMINYNPHDIENKYCGNCHEFEEKKKVNRKLPKDWYWSYILSPIDKTKTKKQWAACAVKWTGEYAKVSGYGIYQEVFSLGITEEDAIKKVRKLIRKGKWKIRPIYFPED